MNDQELDKKLKSVGKKAFVENFNVFQSYSKGAITRESAIFELVDLGVSNLSGASIRVSNAKLIFDAHKEYDALELVLDSQRVPAAVIHKARVLLN